MAGCAAFMSHPRSNPKCWYGPVLRSLLLQEGPIELLPHPYLGEISLPGLLCVLTCPPLPTRYRQHIPWCKVKLSQRTEETMASDSFCFQPHYKSPMWQEEWVPTWLPAAGRVNTERTEINHFSSICPDTFAKALPSATKGTQTSSHPWL